MAETPLNIIAQANCRYETMKATGAPILSSRPRYILDALHGAGFKVVPPPYQERCEHPRSEREMSYDGNWSRCRKCGAVHTGKIGWGVAGRKWFKSLSDAKFYDKHGRLPEATP